MQILAYGLMDLAVAHANSAMTVDEVNGAVVVDANGTVQRAIRVNYYFVDFNSTQFQWYPF